MSEKLLPCPFCGGEVEIIICDDEGNIRDADYEKEPYSGVNYGLSHHLGNVHGSEDCPIATHKDDTLGALLYETPEEAIAEWNHCAQAVRENTEPEGWISITEKLPPKDERVQLHIYGNYMRIIEDCPGVIAIEWMRPLPKEGK